MQRFFLFIFLFVCACNPEEKTGYWNENIHELGLNIEDAVARDQPQLINDYYDYQGLSRLVIEKGRVKDLDMMKMIARSMSRDKQIGETIIRSVWSRGARFDYINQYFEDDRYYVVFKVFWAGGTYDYIELCLEEEETNRNISVIDLYLFSDGFSMSDLYADILLLVEERGTTGEEVLTGIKEIKKIDELLYQGQPEQALKVYESISILFRERALFLKKKIKILTFFEDKTLLRQAVREYEGLYQHDLKFIHFIKLLIASNQEEEQRLLNSLAKYIKEEKTVAI